MPRNEQEEGLVMLTGDVGYPEELFAALGFAILSIPSTFNFFQLRIIEKCDEVISEWTKWYRDLLQYAGRNNGVVVEIVGIYPTEAYLFFPIDGQSIDNSLDRVNIIDVNCYAWNPEERSPYTAGWDVLTLPLDQISPQNLVFHSVQ